MKKGIIFMAIILIFTSAVYSNSEENIIISQTNQIYDDFYMMANAGIITSVEADHFRYNPITEYEAAKYIVEAAGNLYAANRTANNSAQVAKLRKYYEIYRKKAFEIYGKTMEMRKKLKNAEELMKNPEMAGFKEYVDTAYSDIYEIEMAYKETTYRGIPPFKVQGMLTGRFQDVEAFGVGKAHHTSLGGTFMQLWTEGIVTPDVSFKLNLTFEYPNDEADKKTAEKNLPEYWGTGQRFLDKYTINLNIYDFQISTGFFWEDITPFVAKSVLSNRPAMFEKDPYALEETSKGHYENAFYHSFIARGDIWSKHGFMGVLINNMDLFGTGVRFKAMAGKAEKFDELFDRLYQYEYASRLYIPIEFGPLYDTHLAANFFNLSNEQAEIQTMATLDFEDGIEVPYGYFKAQTIVGGDMKTNILNIVELETEFEASDYHGYIPKLAIPTGDTWEIRDYQGDPFNSAPIIKNGSVLYPIRVNQYGNAFYAEAAVKQLPIPVDFEAKYTRIDPGYVAEASAVIDTAEENKKINPDDPTDRHAVIKWDTYAGDPTLIYNNTERMDLFASVEIPGGFINVLYGSASQIHPTTNRVFADHFVVGNRLTSPMWWNMFFSSYGYPDATGFESYLAYSAIDHEKRNTHDTTGQRYLYTTKWLTNKEMFKVGIDDEGKETVKYSNNVSLELKVALNKLLGFKNPLFVQAYGEVISVWNEQQILPNFAGPDTLFSSQFITGFIYYGLTRKIGVMAEVSMERWASRDSYGMDYDYSIIAKPVDYTDTSFGLGFDFDFAPRSSFHFRAKNFYHYDAAFTEYEIVNHPTNPNLNGTYTHNFDGWYLMAEVKNFF